ncbi:nitric oxide synthase oxygenase [Oceanobacillus iheyensis]|uniref:nitric oxide synthase oxygenase n=1 Tax=Oceanobacillus iheyensis TaxID=182710 RepID=UPI00362FCDE9
MTIEKVSQEAKLFLTQYFNETDKPYEYLTQRIAQVNSEIDQKGYYTQTYDEIVYGAKLAWRNSNRCIGRLFWERIEVADARKADTYEEVFDYLLSHIQLSFNHGRIKPYITIFRPQQEKKNIIKIWNHQLLRYAGYQTEEGIIGDSDSIQFTKICEGLGWKGARTNFDILPLVVQIGDNHPQWMEIPDDIIPEIPIEHPDYPEIASLNLKWYAIPIISDMRLEIGGLDYIAAPFNGWYMGTEIGARNFADEYRYNMLPKVAEKMNINTKHESNLWRDRALVELNAAVLYSFKKQGITITDHHTAAKQFEVFEKHEAAKGRDVTGKWTWLIPPVSPATTHIWHKPYTNDILTPNFFYQDKAYQPLSCPFH